MIITITGLPGSGKTSVSKELAKHLHIKHYSIGDIFRKFARKKHEDVIKLMKENPKLVDLLDKKQKVIAKKKNAIIDSRLGAYLIKNADYKIYLSCSLKERVKRIMKREKLDYKETVKKILSRERLELEHYKKHYHVDYRNKKLYNIIINTGGLSIEETVKKILSKINSN